MRLAVPLTLDPRAFAGVDRAARVVDLSGETMGTVWRVRLASPAGADLDALREAIETRLVAFVAELSHWVPNSVLSRFNASAAGTWTALPFDFASVVGTALDVAERSGGAFDPTIGRLVDLWGFGPTARDHAPSDADVATALAASGWRKLAFDRDAQRLRQPGGLWLDFSGIAKGHVVDIIADLLAKSGFYHCLVEVGGEFVGRGMRPDGDPWWVDLETPPGVAMPPLRVALHQLAVATSGNYVRGPHTLAPRSGRPLANQVRSVSVLHASAMLADAWASALTVLGPDRGMALAEREGLAARMIVGLARKIRNLPARRSTRCSDRRRAGGTF